MVKPPFDKLEAIQTPVKADMKFEYSKDPTPSLPNVRPMGHVNEYPPTMHYFRNSRHNDGI